MVEKHILSVPDMSCEHCVKAITGALEGVLPLSDFEVLLSTRQVVLNTSDPLVFQRAEEALRNEGYTPARVL
jgi:copper chaperone CopZ